MKKVMIAAAAAAMICGANAAPVCGVPNTATCYQVYKYTFSGKTTLGVLKAGANNNCGVVTASCYARVPGTFKVQGWEAYCNCNCDQTIGPATVGQDSFAFWMTKPYKADIDNGGATPIAYNIVNVIGNKANQAEAAGTFAGSAVWDAASALSWSLNNAGFVFAGLGKYTFKSGTYSISGNFAAEPAASWIVSTAVCQQTDVYDCRTLDLLCTQYPDTVAFGKWSVKYSASDSKKYMSGKYPSTPSYASIYNVNVP